MLRFTQHFGSTCSASSTVVLTPGGTTSCPTCCCSCSCSCWARILPPGAGVRRVSHVS